MNWSVDIELDGIQGPYNCVQIFAETYRAAEHNQKVYVALRLFIATRGRSIPNHLPQTIAERFD